MSQPTHPRWRNAALLASLAAAGLLALASAWTAALARVPQQRAAVERLLRAQTGLEVQYARLVLRLGFYGPEAEFSDIEMRRPGADTPLLRAPRMVARFESWRLLRGGQLRPGRVLVSGAEIDLRQLGARVRATASATAGATVGASAANAGASAGRALADLEARLPELLAGIPEGSLDFEAATLLWSDPQRSSELLQLRAPRLYASRRSDGAQLTGTLLLPARLGRTLFVAVQLRDDRRAAGDGLHGRLRASGRGLVLAGWRELGVLPPMLAGGSGDLSLTLQLRAGRVQRAEGSVRFARLALRTPQPLQARRFSLASGQFTFSRSASALRYGLQQLELVPAVAAAPARRERGALEFVLDPRDGSGSMSVRRLPLEALAVLASASGNPASPAAPSLQIFGGEVDLLDGRWGAGGTTESLALRGRLSALQLASRDGAWRIDGLDAALVANGPRLQLALQGRALPLRLPWSDSASDTQLADLDGAVVLALAADGWSAAVRGMTVALERGPTLQVAGSAGAVGAAPMAGELELTLAEPLPRERMALLQSLLPRWAPAAFWEAFSAGRLQAANVAVGVDGIRAARLQLRGATLAAAAGRPEATALDADLDWDGQRLQGPLLGGQVGALRLDGGRLSLPLTRGDAGRGSLTVEARLSGAIEAALRLASSGELPARLAADLSGTARIDARLRIPAIAAATRPLELTIDVADARWQPVAGAAPMTDLRGRLRADDRGLRDGRLEGRWLGGAATLRLVGPVTDLRLAASGRLPVAALAAEWAWIDLVDRARNGALEWRAELRRDPDEMLPANAGRRSGRVAARGALLASAPQPDDATSAWRLRVALPGSVRADLRWMPGADAQAPWRIDRGTVVLGDSAAIAGTPGALVVGGRLERLEVAGLAAAVAQLGGSAGWQRPLVGEVGVAELRLGDSALGEARLRFAGSRESTVVDLLGESIAGELRQVHAEPGRLSASFARLRLPETAGPGGVAAALLPLRGSLRLQVADLQRGRRSLGALQATFESDGASVSSRDLALRRGAQLATASGRCERGTLACKGEFVVAAGELGAVLQDLGQRPDLPGHEVTLAASLQWSMQPGATFLDSLRGSLDFAALLEDAPPAELLGPDFAALVAARAASDDGAQATAAGLATAPSWPLLVPLQVVAARQLADLPASGSAAVAPPRFFDRLALRLSIVDGVASIERYEVSGRNARLSVAGRFDLRRGTLEQQAQWYWIAPGVVGAVERLDPRSPLAATLRTLREMLTARPPLAAATTRAGAAAGAVERFTLSGPTATPRVERLPLLESAP